MLYEVGCQNINMKLVCLYEGIFSADHLKSLIPERHGDRDPVRFGHRSHLLFCPFRGGLEGVPQNPVDSTAREHGLLGRKLEFGPFKHSSADRRVFPFVILPNNDEIDVAILPVPQWGLDSRHQLDRTNTGILLEDATNRNQQAPE